MIFWLEGYELASQPGYYNVEKSAFVDTLIKVWDNGLNAVGFKLDKGSQWASIFLDAAPNIELSDKMFWLEDFAGEAQGGYYIRKWSTIDFITDLKLKGFNPVAIRIQYDEDDARYSNNVEVIVEKRTDRLGP